MASVRRHCVTTSHFIRYAAWLKVVPARRGHPRKKGALSNYKKAADEPDDHAIGRSRGGLTTKIHAPRWWARLSWENGGMGTATVSYEGHRYPRDERERQQGSVGQLKER